MNDEQLSDIEMLIIRLCKTKARSEFRFKRILDKFYFTSDKLEYNHLYIILDRIVDKINPIKLSEFVRELSPNKNWYDEEYSLDGTEYWKNCCNILISRIAHTIVHDISGYRKPCWFRNKYDMPS